MKNILTYTVLSLLAVFTFSTNLQAQTQLGAEIRNEEGFDLLDGNVDGLTFFEFRVQASLIFGKKFTSNGQSGLNPYKVIPANYALVDDDGNKINFDLFSVERKHILNNDKLKLASFLKPVQANIDFKKTIGSTETEFGVNAGLSTGLKRSKNPFGDPAFAITPQAINNLSVECDGEYCHMNAENVRLRGVDFGAYCSADVTESLNVNLMYGFDNITSIGDYTINDFEPQLNGSEVTTALRQTSFEDLKLKSKTHNLSLTGEYAFMEKSMFTLCGGMTLGYRFGTEKTTVASTEVEGTLSSDTPLRVLTVSEDKVNKGYLVFKIVAKLNLAN